MYWQDRAERVILNADKTAEEVTDSLFKHYKAALETITKEIESFYGKYADKGILTNEIIQQEIKGADFRRAQKLIKQYLAEVEKYDFKYDPAYRAELKRLSAVAHMTRLEALQANIQWEIENLHVEQQEAFTVNMASTMQETYLRTVFDIQQGVGFGSPFTTLNTAAIHKAVAQKWIGDNYSNRIWQNKDRLTLNLERTIPQGMILGYNPRKIAKEIASDLETSKNNAERLARTEFNMIANQANISGYEAAGVEQYQIVATLDERTSEICFPSTAKVQSIETIENVFRRKYIGDMVTITTASGKQITGTPEHPILTSCGWLPLNKIEPSEHIVYSVIGDVPIIRGKQNISMPTAISEIFDSFSKIAGFGIKSGNSPTAQLNSNGNFRDNKIGIFARIKTILRDNIPASINKHIGQNLFRFCHNSIRLFCLRAFFQLVKSWSTVIMTSEIEIVSISDIIKPSLRTTDCINNFKGTHTGIKKFNYFINIFRRTRMFFATLKMRGKTIFFKKICHSGNSATILFGKFRSGYALPILSENIISKTIEPTFNGHVYNLQTKDNVYINNSIIVHNCQEMDGKVFNVSDIETSVNFPPFHPNERTTTKAYFEPDEIDVLFAKAERLVKMPGGEYQTIPANMPYKEWLANLPPEQQKEIAILRKMHENRSADQDQFANYRKFLKSSKEEYGKETIGGLFEGFPTKFADFQEMKYKEPEKWEIFKGNRQILRGVI